MLNLPDITTQADNERFLALVSSNVKRIRQERNLSQLETAISIRQASSEFYANMKNNAHGKHFICFIYLSFQSSLMRYLRVFQEYSNVGGG